MSARFSFSGYSIEQSASNKRGHQLGFWVPREVGRFSNIQIGTKEGQFK